MRCDNLRTMATSTTNMAQSILRTPSAKVWHQRTPWQAPLCIYESHRAFTVTAHRPAARGSMARQMAKSGQKAVVTKHPKTEMKNQMHDMDSQKLPNDLGLFPDTFIMPTGSRLPSLFKEPRVRIRLEYKRLWHQVINLGAYVTISYSPCIKKA